MPQIAPLVAGDPVRLGPFTLTGRIGEGGQGIVYLGYNSAGERAAVKLLHVKFSGDAAARSRFARELKAAQRVASFCTARVIAADLDGDTPYIASEYIEGRSLREIVETEGPLRGTALDRLAVGTATALTAIHHAGIVHRDFKPDNVLIAADGPRVVDFGIARILDSTGTITSRAIGTPAYMAPEQISGGEVGPHTDVFSWASTIIFAGTGQVAFDGDSIAVVLNRILNHDVDVGMLPEPLRGVVRSCLSKAPAARPTADQILLRLLGRAELHDASPAVLTEGVQVAGADQAPAPPEDTRRTPAGQAETEIGYGPASPRRTRFLAAGLVVASLLAAAGVVGYVQLKGGPGHADVTAATSLVDKARRTGRLVIGVKGDLPGVALASRDNREFSGFEIDFARHIARRLDVPDAGVSFVRVGPADRLAALTGGKVDMVLATWPVNRAESAKVAFAGPYYVAHTGVMVKVGDPYDRLADLRGRRLCAPGGSAAIRLVQRAVTMRVRSAPTYADCMNLINAGEVDAIPGEDVILAGFGNRNHIPMKVLPDRLDDVPYAVGVRRGDTRACAAIRDAIADLYRSGAAARILTRRFSQVAFAPATAAPRPLDCG